MNMFNILLIIMIGSSLLLLLKLFKQQQEMKKLTSIDILKVMKKRKKLNKGKGIAYFKALEKRINLYYLFKKKKSNTKSLYYGILIAELVILVVFVALNKPIFAIVFPLITHFFVIKALDLMSQSIHYYIQQELPNAIKHLIKVMSKTSDLKSMMYETSINLNEPLREIFFEISRRMITENPEKVLAEFADDLDDIWFYAFTFLLVSYKEQSKKSDVIINLTTLANMLDKESYLKEKSITDKKFVVIMNYALIFIGLALFVGNLMLNDHAYTFFFHDLTGMICLIAGTVSIVGTILINLVMSKKPE